MVSNSGGGRFERDHAAATFYNQSREVNRVYLAMKIEGVRGLHQRAGRHNTFRCRLNPSMDWPFWASHLGREERAAQKRSVVLDR